MPSSRPVVIRPESSAVAAKNRKPSRAIEAAISVLKTEGTRRVCEVGCGLLANTEHILRAFQYVILSDTKAQYERIKDRLLILERKHSSYRGFVEAESFRGQRLSLDAAIIINVIHILPSAEERIRLLKETARNLKQRGLAFVDVPRNEAYYRDSVKTATRYGDGHIMRRNGFYTFYKNLDFDEIRRYMEAVGLRVVQRIYIDHRVSLLARKGKGKID